MYSIIHANNFFSTGLLSWTKIHWTSLGVLATIATYLLICKVPAFRFNDGIERVDFTEVEPVQFVTTQNYQTNHSERAKEKPLKCSVNVPCEYPDEVDFRVMVISYDRPKSLEKCLTNVERVDTTGDRMKVEIWIDRSKTGKVNNDTVSVANNFMLKWENSKYGLKTSVHIREKNAGITGQWTDTWRPSLGSNEIGLILEDDVDVAPMAYRWLKAVHARYGNRTDLQGYTLQMQDIYFFAGGRRPMAANETENAFMYGVLGTWGFSPHPKTWREFQDWAHDVRDKGKVKPYVPGIRPTSWYQMFERQGKASGMWEMWHIYFSYLRNLYCVYPNLKAYTRKKDVLLSWNRKEKGLHFKKGAAINSSQNLMSHWKESYLAFPERTIQFNYDGSIRARV